MKVPANIVDAAMQTLTLERQQGTEEEDALRKAVLAAMLSYRRHLYREISEVADARADWMISENGDPELAEDGHGALMFLASALRGEVPLDDVL